MGAEFIRGIGSVLNDIIVESNIDTEETFNLCEDKCNPSQLPSYKEHRKSENDNDHVKLFGDEQLWSLRQGGKEIDKGGRFSRLMRKAKQIWQSLEKRSNSVRSSGLQFVPKDTSVSKYVEEKMEYSSAEDLKSVKKIIDVLYAKVAGTTVEYLGCNEGSREDSNWEYGERNFRTKGSFSDIIMHYVDEIQKINELSIKPKIDIVTNTPISSIEPLNNDVKKGANLSPSNGSQFIADKVVLAVPLSVLKAKKFPS